MGRNREYDEGVVLTNAMHAFRQKGYSGVSIKELEDATDLKAGSIYNSYGDKAGMFNAALAHYKQSVVRRRISEHAQGAMGLQGLRGLFLTLLEEPNGESFGCLVTNSAIEFGGGTDVPPDVTESLRLFSQAFANRLEVSRLGGTLRNDVEIDSAALELLALYQGVLVLIRAGWDKSELETMIHGTFDRLGETSHGT